MKIRNGFVSNSSSSSFLLMTTIENHEKVLEKLNSYEKAVMKQIAETGHFLGKEVVYVGDLSVMDCSYTFEDFDLKNHEGPITEDSYPCEAFGKYDEVLKEVSKEDEIFYWRMG